jgi:acyl-CoA synthetase (AMP-forming)/AMP-acid ligase II
MAKPAIPTRASLAEEWRAAGFIRSHSLADEIARAAAARPDAKLVFWSRHGSVDAAVGQVWEKSTAVAASLHGMGLRKGDRLAIQLPNWIEGVVMLVAALRLGLVVVPLILIYGPTEVRFILRQSGARAIVVPAAWNGTDFVSRTLQIDGLAELRHVVAVGETAVRDSRVVAYDDLASHDPAAAPVGGSVQPADICALVYTSGTTGGEPKGAIHTNESLTAEIITTAQAWYPRDASQTTLVCFPAGHVGGLVMTLLPVMHASGGIFVDAWDAPAAAALIAQHRVSWTVGTPFHLATLLEAAQPHQLDSLRQFVCGAASVPPALIEKADARGIIAFRAFGATEHPTVTTGTVDHDLRQRAHTDGTPNPGSLVRIVDDAGKDCPTGASGEVVTMGPELFSGYLDPALDAAAFTAEGWYRTGDIGVLDALGALTIVDRKKDLVIRGGENISSKEVEDILRRLPKVLDAAVVGWPDARYGERVCAFVQLREGETLALAEVDVLFRQAGVARQKTPERLVPVAEFQRTAAGKVIKPHLRREAARLAALEQVV